MDEPEKLNSGGGGKIFLMIVILLAIPLIPFLLLSSYGLAEVEFWTDALQPLSHPGLQAMAIILMMSFDLFLPIPSIPILLWSGHQLGFVVGTIINISALTIAHSTAYELCRWGGVHSYRRFIGPKVNISSSTLFNKYGPFALAISRNLPIVSEVFSALAGLSEMPRARFQYCILVSNLPTALTLAWLGSKGDSTLMLTASIFIILIPFILITTLYRFIK